MRHVICKLPNASESISGVEFVRQDDGSVMTAEPMEDAAAEGMFGGIPGYEFVDPDAAPADPAAPKRGRMSAAEKAAKAAAEASETPPAAPDAAPADPAAPAAPEAPAA
jgi:hypothetical protein